MLHLERDLPSSEPSRGRGENPLASRSRQGIGRALWSGVDAAAAPATALLTTAGLVRCLGASDYGLLVIALAASGLSLAISPAVAATTTKFVSQSVGMGDSSGRLAARAVTASLLVLAAISACVLLVTAALRNPLAHAVFGEAGRQGAGEILLLAVLSMCIQQVDSVFAAALKGLERFREQAILEIGLRLLVAILVVATALLTRDLQLVLLAQCAACAGAAAARGAALRALAPERRLFAVPGRSDFRAIWSFGSWMWLSAIAGMAYYSVDRIIVGHVLGAAAAGQFNIYLQITQLIHFVPSSLFAFTFPVFSRLSAEARGGSSAITHSYGKYVAISCGASLLIAMTIVSLRSDLLKLFVGGTVYAGQDSAFVLLTCAFLVLSSCVIAYYLLLALGRSRAVSLVGTVAMLVAVALMVALIPRYGLRGAAVSRLAYAVANLALLERAHRSLQSLRRESLLP
jgi:O-antigen/teichoic acid export membrane protein